MDTDLNDAALATSMHHIPIGQPMGELQRRNIPMTLLSSSRTLYVWLRLGRRTGWFSFPQVA